MSFFTKCICSSDTPPEDKIEETPENVEEIKTEPEFKKIHLGSIREKGIRWKFAHIPNGKTHVVIKDIYDENGDLAPEYNKLRSSAEVSPRPRRIEQFLDQLNEQEGKVKIIKIDTHSLAKYIEEHNHILV